MSLCINNQEQQYYHNHRKRDDEDKIPLPSGFLNQFLRFDRDQAQIFRGGFQIIFHFVEHPTERGEE